MDDTSATVRARRWLAMSLLGINSWNGFSRRLKLAPYIGKEIASLCEEPQCTEKQSRVPEVSALL